MRTWAVWKPIQCSTVNYDAFNQSVAIKFYYRCDRKIVVFLKNRKVQLLFFCNKSKENTFFLKRTKACVFGNSKNRKVMPKKVASTTQFLSFFFSSSHAKGKCKLTNFKINLLIKMLLRIMDKTVRNLQRTQLFVLGHVTFGVTWWRHKRTVWNWSNYNEVMSSYSQLNFP